MDHEILYKRSEGPFHHCTDPSQFVPEGTVISNYIKKSYIITHNFSFLYILEFEEIELAWIATEQKIQTSDSRLSMITYF